MAKAMNRALLLCALAIGGTVLLCPAQAKEGTAVLAAIPGVPTSDSVLQKAIDYLQESKNAHQRQIRRENLQPTPVQERVVRHSNSDRMLILGVDGASALPM